jgi:glycosyltransferase involved in cell wall biosynthesis
MAAVLAAESLGIPSVYEVRGLWMLTRVAHDPAFAATPHFRELLAVELEVCLRADYVLPISGALADFLHGVGIPRQKMHIMPNAVDSTDFAPRRTQVQLREQYGLGESHVVGYIGSLVDYEGLDLLLLAIHDLRAQGFDVSAIVVGGGGEAERLRSLARGMGLEGAVVMPGAVEATEVPSLYGLIDTAVFPRLSRTVTELVPPIKPLEAMASGKTVIASDCRALMETVRDGETGMVFPAGDVSAFAACIGRAAADRDLVTSLRTTARDFVVRERSWSRVCGDALTFISSGREAP